MPKVSQEYRDARREHILQAAKRCFLRNGFQATSMQDLFAESQLSSGSFYVYFTSKDDVILAIVEENMSQVMALIHHLATNPHEAGLGEALATVIETIRVQDRAEHLGALAVLVWSEALRSPHVRDRFLESLRRMREDLALVIVEQQADGSLPKTVVPEDLAQLVIAIVPGVIQQLALLGDQAIDGVAAAVRAVWPVPRRTRRSRRTT